MTKHRQPEDGYTSDAKQEYRESVWFHFHRQLHPSDISKGEYILLLPGLQCDEIDTAISMGYKPEHLLLVHESSTHVEDCAEWLSKYPSIKFYSGVKVSEIGPKLKEDNAIIVAANLDFCNNFSLELNDEFDSFMSIKNVSSDCLTAVTVMKGRESKVVVRMLEKIKDSKSKDLSLNEKRLIALLSLSDHGFNRVYAEGNYVHSRAPMAWCIARSVDIYADDARILKQLLSEWSSVELSVNESVDAGLRMHERYQNINIAPLHIYGSERNKTIRGKSLLEASKLLIEMNKIYKSISSLEEMYCMEAERRGYKGRFYYRKSTFLGKISDFTCLFKHHRSSGILVPRGWSMDHPDCVFQYHGDEMEQEINKHINNLKQAA